MLYNFELENTSDLMRDLAARLKQRRLERGLSRGALFLTLLSNFYPSVLAGFRKKIGPMGQIIFTLASCLNFGDYYNKNKSPL
jgi:hypothetical protein